MLLKIDFNLDNFFEVEAFVFFINQMNVTFIYFY